MRVIEARLRLGCEISVLSLFQKSNTVLATGLTNDGINWSPPTGPSTGPSVNTRYAGAEPVYEPWFDPKYPYFPGAQYRLGDASLYGSKLDAAAEMVRDSANAAGAPSRTNVWEHGFPELAPSGTPEPISPPIATGSVPSAFYNAVLASPIQSDLAGSINFILISWNLSQQPGPVRWPDASSATH